MNKYALAANLIAQVQKVRPEFIERAGARHSATDRVLVQQLHDIAMELGAECHHDEGEMMSVEDMRRYAPHPMLKAAVEALVLRHPGHANQKTHGNRFGGYGTTKESLRRLKDDKGAREAYKTTARKRAGGGDSKIDSKEFKTERIKKDKIPKPEELAKGKPDLDTINRFRRMSNEGLTNEYGDLYKHSFNSMFGHNAKHSANLAAAVLHERGVRYRKNIFGDLPIEFL